MQWESVIGLEIHTQLRTKSKLFSGAATAFGAEPNTHACAIDVALPGTLPVLNQEVLTMAVKFGLSIQAQITEHTVFCRKNYFYPDLPKGYQISQHLAPIVQHGHIDVIIDANTQRRVIITRAHLEEDAGKSLHEAFPQASGIDLNRAGTPLLEIVTAPDLRSAQEAALTFKLIRDLVVYLGICDGNMQEGSLRCDANVSIRRKGDTTLGTRTEIKNLNSFRFIERAIEGEIERQIDLLESGGTVLQQTRHYDADKNETRPLRSKEEAHDYRYFDDPDLLPVHIDAAFIEKIRQELPELPTAKQQRFETQYGLGAYDASVLAASQDSAAYFEAVMQNAPYPAKLAANWIVGQPVDVWTSPITPTQLAQLLMRLHDNTLSTKLAKTVFEALLQQEGEVDDIIKTRGLSQVSDSAQLEKIIADIIAKSPEQLADYRAGKDKLFAYFVGQVMKATQGKANPQQVNDLLKVALA